MKTYQPLYLTVMARTYVLAVYMSSTGQRRDRVDSLRRTLATTQRNIVSTLFTQFYRR